MTQVWLVRCGGGGRYVEDAVAQGLITIDFHEARDVTGLSVNEIAIQLSTATTRTAFAALAKLSGAAVGQAVALTPEPRSTAKYGGSHWRRHDLAALD